MVVNGSFSHEFKASGNVPSSPDIKNHYKRFRAHVQKSIRDAYWKHITNIFSFENDNPDPDCPRKNEKAKKFWSFVKSLKKDASGINTLRENGILKTDTLDKANICMAEPSKFGAIRNSG